MTENKKIALLKEISNGTFQRNGETKGVAKLFGHRLVLSLYGLPKREYSVIYIIENSAHSERFTGEEITVDENIQSLAVVIFENEKIIPVAYGKFTGEGESLEEIVEIAQKPYQKSDETTVENTVFQEEEYDDEAVATYNYYELEESEVNEDVEQTEGDGANSGQDEDYGEKTQDGNVEGDEPYEDGFGEEFSKSDGERDFFRKIQSEIETLFKTYPIEENLTSMVHGSKWVKISLDDGKHYVVGIINKNGNPAYICYGLPSDYYSPPQEIRGYKSFIPISPFNLKGKGYWVMYQDANTGK